MAIFTITPTENSTQQRVSSEELSTKDLLREYIAVMCLAFIIIYVHCVHSFFPFRYMALGIALRYVLDALRKPFQSKMYLFGITALDRFRMR